MARYLRKGQIAICQRSGKKMYRDEMEEDGQIKGLLVHPDWYEPYHPLLIPPFMFADGMPKRRPAPDGVPAPLAPVLSGAVVGSNMVMNWTPSISKGSQIDYYWVYVSLDGAPYAFAAQINNSTTVTITDGDGWQQASSYAQPYSYPLVGGHTYSFVVLGHAIEGGFSPASNILNNAKPNAPVLSVVVVGSAATLSWTESSPAQSYNVSQSFDGVTYTTLASGVIPTTYAIPIVSSDPFFSNVVILVHGDGPNTGIVFSDSSSYRHAVVAQSFAATTSSDHSLFGSETSIKNNTDNVGLSVTPSECQVSGALDFTIEGWFYSAAAVTTQGIFQLHDSSGQDPIHIGFSGGVLIANGTASGGGNLFTLAGSTTATSGAFHHYALVRQGSQYTIYLDGNREATQSAPGTLHSANGLMSITQVASGSFSANNFYFDELRFTNGTARYSGASFAVPTGPFPDAVPSQPVNFYVTAVGANGVVSNPSNVVLADPLFGSVSLLMHMDGANSGTVFTDSSSFNSAFTRQGTAVTSTAQFKFGTASYFGDLSANSPAIYKQIATGDQFDLTTVDFTIEMFIRKTTADSGGANYYFQSLLDGSTASQGYRIGVTSTNTIQYFDATYFGAYNMATAAISLDVWHHIAFSRIGQVFMLFVDGNLTNASSIVRRAATDINLGSLNGTYFTIGGFHFSSLQASFSGYIDEVRVTKGYARYTKSFTPPTGPF